MNRASCAADIPLMMHLQLVQVAIMDFKIWKPAVGLARFVESHVVAALFHRHRIRPASLHLLKPFRVQIGCVRARGQGNKNRP